MRAAPVSSALATSEPASLYVPGVLLNHPDQHLAQRHEPAPAAMLVERVVDRDAETGSAGDEPFGKLDLIPSRLPRFFGHSLVGGRSVEVASAVGVGAE